MTGAPLTPDSLRLAEAPPADASAPVQALWHAARDDWDAAHRLVQDDGSRDAAWVHAHLHRLEGDPVNAQYWYWQAGRQPSAEPFDLEWHAIARELLGRQDA